MASSYQALDSMRQMIDKGGLAWLARELGIDKSNLAKMAKGERAFSRNVVGKVLSLKARLENPHETA
ncbi:MAG: hypothetical protein JO273_16430 [Methylobacteriaceae bacterium]|nr:hypothetical protein [Methylobacteriaceae bacterium]